MTLGLVIDALLDEFAGVVAGDRVLVLTAPEVDVDAGVLAALDAGLRARGAAPATLRLPRFDARTEDVPPALAGALPGADVLLDLADHESLVHTPTARAAVHDGLRLVSISLRTIDDWTSPFATFPLERLFARARTGARRLAAGGHARLTTPQGTDLRFLVPPGRVRGMPGGPLPAPMRRGTGGFALFPPGALGTSPERAEGTLVLDALVGFRGRLARPIRLSVEEGFVREVSGGPEADWLRERIATHANGGFVAKLLTGIHPAAPLDAGLLELERRKSRLSRAEGVTLVGLGDARSVGGSVASTWHWDGVILPPVTWEVAGRVVFEAGTLQGPPEIIHLDRVADVGPHRPQPVARAGELVALHVDARGELPHVHRNPESDELWIPLGGPPLRVSIEGAGERSLGPGQAALIPRGAAHKVTGADVPSPLLVFERVPHAARPVPATPAPCESFDLLALAGGLTAHWSRPARSLCASSASFDVELHVRPEGMLRPDQAVEVPELWLPLRGALAVEWEDTPPSDEVGPGALLSLPAGGRARVVSVRPDTVALRLRCS
jgi:hypothetical protein